MQIAPPFFSLYVHTPFCRKKCNYCAFYSVTGKYKINNYISALKQEIDIYKDTIENKKSVYKTIYFGGGTPSFLSTKNIEILLTIFDSIKHFKELIESNFELNPDSIDEDKIKLLKDFGINRLSIGLQTTNDIFLKFLGRIHDYSCFLKKYDIARKYFDNINIDLIYGISGQSKSDIKKDIENITSLYPSHISLYALEIYSNTAFKKISIDERQQSDLYFLIRDLLNKKRYIHYEISNFALDSYFSFHNLNYWGRGEYMGFGPSASSSIGNKRWKNKSDLDSYITSLNNDKIEFEYIDELTEKDVLNERLMLGLRKIDGIKTYSALYLNFKESIQKQIDKGYMEILNGSVKIKDKFLFVSNTVISDIIF